MAQLIDFSVARKVRLQRAARMAEMFGPVAKITRKVAKRSARKDEVRARARAAL